MNEFKLHPIQKKILKVKSKRPLISVKNLTDLLKISSTSVTQHHINRLRKYGYLTKHRISKVAHQKPTV